MTVEDFSHSEAVWARTPLSVGGGRRSARS